MSHAGRPRNSDRTRREVVGKVLEAIKTTENLAKTEAQDLSLRVKWYQVMGYLAQTLDGLLSNVDQTEADKQLEQLREIVVRIQQKSQRNPPTGTTG